MIRRPPLVPILGLLAAISAPRTARAQAMVKSDSAAARAAIGRTLFEGKGLCFSCHGKNGEGILGLATRLKGRPLAHVKATIPDVVALIKTGVDSAHSTSGQLMPPQGGSRLTDREMDALARYVLELQKKQGKPR